MSIELAKNIRRLSQMISPGIMMSDDAINVIINKSKGDILTTFNLKSQLYKFAMNNIHKSKIANLTIDQENIRFLFNELNLNPKQTFNSTVVIEYLIAELIQISVDGTNSNILTDKNISEAIINDNELKSLFDR
jgi:hypothetical protein